MSDDDRPRAGLEPVAAETGDSGAPQPPLLRVVRGQPSPEELAALVAVVAAAAGAPSEASPAQPRRWGAPATLVRAPLPTPGPGAWKAAGWR